MAAKLASAWSTQGPCSKNRDGIREQKGREYTPGLCSAMRTLGYNTVYTGMDGIEEIVNDYVKAAEEYAASLAVE